MMLTYQLFGYVVNYESCLCILFLHVEHWVYLFTTKCTTTSNNIFKVINIIVLTVDDFNIQWVVLMTDTVIIVDCPSNCPIFHIRVTTGHVATKVCSAKMIYCRSCCDSRACRSCESIPPFSLPVIRCNT